MQGPGTCDFRIGRNYSFCTKLQGVFCDRLTGTIPPDAPRPHSLTGEPTLGLLYADRLKAADGTGGVLVYGVEPDGPAHKAGCGAATSLCARRGSRSQTRRASAPWSPG